MRRNPVKAKLRAGLPAIGTWLSLGNVTAARFMARSGFDWLTVDIEHSLVNIETATHMLGAIADAGCVALARVPSNRHDHIKRVLDGGGHGVVIPMVNTPQEATDAVSACLYPPVGTRSVGGSVHALNWNATPSDYFAHVNDELLVVLQCEHIDAVRNFDAVFGRPNVDVVFVGPNDLAASMRTADGQPPSVGLFQETLKEILAKCKSLSLAAGIHAASAEEAQIRIAEGWQFIAISSELKMMVDGANKIVASVLGTNPSAELAKY